MLRSWARSASVTSGIGASVLAAAYAVSAGTGFALGAVAALRRLLGKPLGGNKAVNELRVAIESGVVDVDEGLQPCAYARYSREHRVAVLDEQEIFGRHLKTGQNLLINTACQNTPAQPTTPVVFFQDLFCVVELISDSLQDACVLLIAIRCTYAALAKAPSCPV
jgi:hypothetical protein